MRNASCSTNEGVKSPKDASRAPSTHSHLFVCVCVCESKTQKWFLTFQLINLLQLNTFNDFWRWCLPHSVLFVFLSSFTLLTFLLAQNCQATREQAAGGSGKLWEPSLPFFAVIFSNWFNMRACLCVCVHACACACACGSLKFSYFISFHLCFRLCFAFVAVASPFSSFLFACFATFRRLFS